MPSIHLPYVNIAIDAFALIVTLIIFIACHKEFAKKKAGTIHFLILQLSVSVALVTDMIGWVGEGHRNLSLMTTVSNTASTVACYVAIISFMAYLVAVLYANSRAAKWILCIFRVLCALSMIFCIGNGFLGYAFAVKDDGHWHRVDSFEMGLVYLLFPLLSFFAIISFTTFAKSSARVSRITYFVCTLFPVAGVILDFAIHGISLTYAGLAISILTMYTGIYLERKRQLEAQKSALMLSQINPHFIYNTLSTIASMCDTSPKQAKYLTIDFAQYLRRNINTLTSEELIPFDQEMDHVACYLKIEQARFRDKLNIVYFLQCKDFSLPPLTIQPIVENAVKHGITKRAEGGTVKVSSYDNETHYIIEVIDDGVGFDTERADMHVGIENVRNRLSAMCKGKLTVKSTIGVGTRVTIEIPKRKGVRK